MNVNGQAFNLEILPMPLALDRLRGQECPVCLWSGTNTPSPSVYQNVMKIYALKHAQLKFEEKLGQCLQHLFWVEVFSCPHATMRLSPTPLFLMAPKNVWVNTVNSSPPVLSEVSPAGWGVSVPKPTSPPGGHAGEPFYWTHLKSQVCLAWV